MFLSKPSVTPVSASRFSLMIDPFKKAKLKWQCRRGMLELDLILNRFLESQLDHMTEQQMDALGRLLNESDPELFAWLMSYGQPACKELVELVEFIKLHDYPR